MRTFKKIISAVTASIVTLSAAASSLSMAATVTAADMTAVELVEAMGQGWNLGNSFDCTNTWTSSLTPEAIETAWGNPVTTNAIISEIHKNGFNTVRIPITWYQMCSSDGSTIDADYVARIKEVLGYVLDNGMYAIIDTHHDETWIQTGSNEAKFIRLWNAIATEFKQYDQHVIFEGTNECDFGNNEMQMTYNQLFVDTVRKTGGNNANRLLLVPANANNTDKALDSSFSAPTDSANMVAVSVHYYEPSTFCVAKTTSSWGHQETWGTDADVTKLENHFDSLEKKFINNGIPVIIGEYGVDTSTQGTTQNGQYVGPGNKDKESMKKFLKTVATYALSKDGMCPVVWDMSVDGDGKGDMAYFNRETLTWYDPEIQQVFIDAANSSGADIDTKKSDRVTKTYDEMLTQDVDEKTGELLDSYSLIFDLEPYKDFGVKPVTAIVNFKMDAPDATEASGDVVISFNVADSNGDLHWSRIDTPVGINDTVTVVDMVPDEFETGWDSTGAVTETTVGSIDMDKLKIENWWTWANKGSASITFDSVTVIFDGYVAGEGVEPSTTEPETTEPETTEPETTEPETTEPETTEPETTEPETTEPETTEPESTDPSTVIYGDVDDDGKVDLLDVITINKSLLGGCSLTERGRVNADVNRNGTPDSTDALNILKAVVEIISVDSFPIA